MASHNVRRDTVPTERTAKQRQEELQEIQAYKELEELINAKVAERQHTLEVLELTSKLLKKNPEYYTIWNVRRRLLTHGLFSRPSPSSSPSKESRNTLLTDTTSDSHGDTSSSSSRLPATTHQTPPTHPSPNLGKNGTTLDLIKADLEFLFPIMVKFPKCYWLWNYRVWLLEQANARLEADVARQLWERELGLVGKMLVRDSRNFHGWGYRRRIVMELESQELNGKSMVETEFEYTTKMIHGDKGLSNFSAWHRRSKLIPRLLEERGANDAERRQFLDDEFDLIISAMYTDSYPYAQSAWFYHQFLMTTLIDPPGHNLITPAFTSKDRIAYIKQQIDTLKEMLDGAEDCKWIYSALIEYTLITSQLENRNLSSEERADCERFLIELRSLDPFRSGRWDDLQKALQS